MKKAISMKMSEQQPSMEHLLNDHEDHPNQDENSHKLCNEMFIGMSMETGTTT